MNVIWRTLLQRRLSLRRLRREGPLSLRAVSRIQLTTLLTDLDLVWHMNNGRYLSLFDLGRFDFFIRTGIWEALSANGWSTVVAHATITFRKSLRLNQKFVVETAIIAVDDRAVFLENRAVVNGEIYASLIVRGRFVKLAGGVLPVSELLDAMGVRLDEFPAPEPWLQRWVSDVSLPPTKAAAPSEWDTNTVAD